MSIDATVAGVAANSYVTLAEAATYFTNRMNFATWDNSTEQEEALLMACAKLETYDYVGIPLNNTLMEDGYVTTIIQALKWPRCHVDGTKIRNYPTTIIPQQIKNAQCETALWLIQSGGVGVAVAAGAVESLKIGDSIEAKYSTGSSGAAVVDTSVDQTNLSVLAAQHLKGLRLYAVIG
jgi:hypothetical protein